MSSLKLTSFTPLTTQLKKKLITIWQTIYDSNDSFQFKNPVDWKGMGLTDYLKYVKKPMDLNSISKNIRDQKYKTVENVLDDIQLIFDNCKAYNAPKSYIYDLADKLEKFFIKMIRNFMPKIIQSNPKSKINLKINDIQQNEQPMQQEHNFYIEQVGYNDKIKFTDKLSHLNSQNLQIILKKIIMKNPDAFHILKPQDQEGEQKVLQVKILQSLQKLQQSSQKLQQFSQKLQKSSYKPQLLQKLQQNEVKKSDLSQIIQQKIQQSLQKAQIVQQIMAQQRLVQSLNPQKTQIQRQKQVEQLVQVPLIQVPLVQAQLTQQKMQIQQQQQQKLPKRVCRTRTITKVHTKKQNSKLTLQKMQVGAKAQILIDNLTIDNFQDLLKMLNGMVEEKDKVMKKIKLD